MHTIFFVVKSVFDRPRQLAVFRDEAAATAAFVAMVNQACGAACADFAAATALLEALYREDDRVRVRLLEQLLPAPLPAGPLELQVVVEVVRGALTAIQVELDPPAGERRFITVVNRLFGIHCRTVAGAKRAVAKRTASGSRSSVRLFPARLT